VEERVQEPEPGHRAGREEDYDGGAGGVIQDIISVRRLVEARRRALRRGTWFRALDRAERAIIGLTIRCVDRIRSPMLAKIVTATLIKLKLVTESRVKTIVRTVGRSLARRVSRIAQDWGNRSARQWTEDRGFIQYLSVMCVNTPEMFRV